MKRLIMLTFLFIFLFSCSVRGKELITEDDFDFNESMNLLNEKGFDDIKPKEIIGELLQGNVKEVLRKIYEIIKGRTIDDFFYVKKLMINLMLIMLISSFFSNFINVFENTSVSDTAFYICYISAISVIATIFDFLTQMTMDFFNLMIAYISAALPTYFITVSLSGQASAMGFYQVILVAIGVIQYLFLKLFLPLIKIYLSIGLVNNISREDLLSKMCGLIKKAIVKGNRFFVRTITGINVLQAMILPAIDLSKNTMTYKVMNTIPGVGNSLGAYSGVLLGSINLIKNTMGGFIIVVILVICGVPYIKMKIYHILIQLLTALIQPVADKRMLSGIQVAADSIGMMAELIAGVAILFIVSIVIICISTNMIR